MSSFINPERSEGFIQENIPSTKTELEFRFDYEAIIEDRSYGTLPPFQ
jgi:hypothetical protein